MVRRVNKGASMKFSYSAVWADTVAMLRANASLIAGIAGVFIFLPALLVAHFLPQPEGAATMAAMMADMEAYLSANWHWMLLANVVNMLGSIAIYLLLFDPRGRTVGSAIGCALPILPFYFILSVLVGLIVIFGLFWLILPGIYLIGRLAPSTPLMVAEGRRSPFDALRRSWRLTGKRGWAVAGLIVIVFVVGYIVIAAVTAVIGSIFLLALGREGLGGLLVAIIGAALSAILSTVMLVLAAALYRHLVAVRESSQPAAAD